MNTTYEYNVKTGWMEIKCFVEDYYEGDLNDFMWKNEYINTTKLGDQTTGFAAHIYMKEEYTTKKVLDVPYQFIVVVIIDSIQFIVVPNLPSLIELLSKISPISYVAAYTEMQLPKYE